MPKHNYEYDVVDLSGNSLGTYKSMPEIAKKFGTTVDTIVSRLHKKVNTKTMFRKDNLKFNVKRREK